jgi:lysophospholipid acyltransferase (LPLAT)-like uncharacterized protein
MVAGQGKLFPAKWPFKRERIDRFCQNMKNSFLHRYKVYNVPLRWKPVFYLYSYGFTILFLCYILLVHLTCKIEFSGRECLREHKNYIFCFWHAYVPFYGSLFIHDHSQVWMQHPFWYMKPVHLFLNITGVKKLVLGSAGYSGRKAADQLVELLKQGFSTVFLPDGPNGPPLVAKKGILHISLQSQVPIVPMQIRSERFIESPGWDRKKWPIPFSSIQVRFGKPIIISEKSMDKAYKELVNALG